MLNNISEQNWQGVYLTGSISSAIIILTTIFDIIFGAALGGDLTAIPQTAADTYVQLQNNWLLGVYHLDLLNFVTTILMIPTFFALFAAHRQINPGGVLLAAVVYFIGAAIFVANNAALPMLELSSKYALSSSEVQKTLLAAAGETLLAKGTHGSPGAFPGFLLLSLGSIGMSYGMLKGKVFSKTTAWLGIIGGLLLLLYVILVTFVPQIKPAAVLVAAPGGLLALAWMIMYTIKLFKLGLAK